MKLVIIPSIIWLISVALAIQTPEILESAKKRSKHVERIEAMVCSARLENIKFKCNLEYKKIDIKADLETIKSNTVCKKVMNNLEANCDESGDENCRSRKDKLQRSCEIRLADIKIYQSKAIDYVADVCDKTLRNANYECAKDRLVKKLNSRSEKPKNPWRFKLRNGSKNKKDENQHLINFIFGDRQYELPKAEVSSYIKEVFGKKRAENHDSVEEPEPIKETNLSEAQINLANEERERLSKLTKNPDLNHIMNPSMTTTISGEKYTTGSIVNFVFGDYQHTIPQTDLAQFVTEIYKTTSPSSILPTQVSTETQPTESTGFVTYKLESTTGITRNKNIVQNPNIEALIDYIFQRLKHKIENHTPYSSSDQRWGRNIQPIMTYLFGRYKHKVEKHNLSKLINNKGDEKSVLLQIILDLIKGYRYRSPRSFEKKPKHIYLTSGRRNPRFYKISRFNDERSRIRIPDKINVSFIFQILDEIFDRSKTPQFSSKPNMVKLPNGKSRSRHYQYSYHHTETNPGEHHIHGKTDSDAILIYKIITHLLKLNKAGLESILDTIYYRMKHFKFPERSANDIKLILNFLDKVLHRYLNNRRSYRNVLHRERSGFRMNKARLQKIYALLEDERENLENRVDVTFIFKILDNLFKDDPSNGETKPQVYKSQPEKQLFQSDDKEVDREKDKSQSDETESRPQIVHYKPDREHFKPHLDRNRYKLQITKPETEVDADEDSDVQEEPETPSDSDDEKKPKLTTVKSTTKKIKVKSKFTTKKPKIVRGKHSKITSSSPLPTKQQSKFTVKPHKPEFETPIESGSSLKPVVGLSQEKEITTARPLPFITTPKVQMGSSSNAPLSGKVTEISVSSSESISKSKEAGGSVTNPPNVSSEQLPASSIGQSTISLETTAISLIQTNVSEEQSKFSTEPANISSNIITKSSEESGLTTQTPLGSTEPSVQTTEQVKITTEESKTTSGKR